MARCPYKGKARIPLSVTLPRYRYPAEEPSGMLLTTTYLCSPPNCRDLHTQESDSAKAPVYACRGLAPSCNIHVNDLIDVIYASALGLWVSK